MNLSNLPKPVQRLSDEELRAQVLRARSMTEAERLAEAFRLMDEYYLTRQAEIKREFPDIHSDEEINRILGERMDKERTAEEKGWFIPLLPMGRFSPRSRNW